MSRAIDADRLLTDRIKSKYYHLPNGDIAIPLIDIEHAPTIHPERKKGQWVGADSQCGIGCPFCGMPVDDFCNSIDYIDLSYEPNFCPNCGADMRGKQDEID